MTNINNIISLLSFHGELSAKDLAHKTNLSRQFIHRLLKNLLLDGKIIKLGKAPLTFYKLIQHNPQLVSDFNVPYPQLEFLKNNFILISENGIMLEGIEAFSLWCKKQNLPLEKTIKEYIETRKKYLQHYNSKHFIDGTEKLKNTKAFSKIHLDKLLYLDFYAIERFGKTRLGTLMHFAKQGQNKKLMAQIITQANEKILNLILKNKIDAVLFVPPTIKRDLQIMTYLKKNLGIPCFDIGIKKVNGEIAIPQKALSKIEDRISNAQMSFVVTEKLAFKKILIIDDAVGSGATINEIAGKLRHKKTAKTIWGLAITGSYKGFDVISEL